MHPFLFISDVPALSDENALIVEIGPQLADKEALLAWFAGQLAFPSYFGRNWDAFEECLGDLSWIEQRQIVLFHRDLPLIDPKDRRIYPEVLADAVHHWRSDPSHEIVAVFDPSLEAKVLSTMIVARVAVFVFSDRPDNLRAAMSAFEEEAREWRVLTRPRVSWDAAKERLILKVDVTAEDRDTFGLEGYAEFVADQAYKITFAAVADAGTGGVRVLGIYPA